MRTIIIASIILLSACSTRVVNPPGPSNDQAGSLTGGHSLMGPHQQQRTTPLPPAR